MMTISIRFALCFTIALVPIIKMVRSPGFPQSDEDHDESEIVLGRIEAICELWTGLFQGLRGEKANKELLLMKYVAKLADLINAMAAVMDYCSCERTIGLTCGVIGDIAPYGLNNVEVKKLILEHPEVKKVVAAGLKLNDKDSSYDAKQATYAKTAIENLQRKVGGTVVGVKQEHASPLTVSKSTQHEPNPPSAPPT